MKILTVAHTAWLRTKQELLFWPVIAVLFCVLFAVRILGFDETLAWYVMTVAIPTIGLMYVHSLVLVSLYVWSRD